VGGIYTKDTLNKEFIHIVGRMEWDSTGVHHAAQEYRAVENL
jgi:hypothetical protein